MSSAVPLLSRAGHPGGLTGATARSADGLDSCVAGAQAAEASLPENTDPKEFEDKGIGRITATILLYPRWPSFQARVKFFQVVYRFFLRYNDLGHCFQPSPEAYHLLPMKC